MYAFITLFLFLKCGILCRGKPFLLIHKIMSKRCLRLHARALSIVTKRSNFMLLNNSKQAQ